MNGTPRFYNENPVVTPPHCGDTLALSVCWPFARGLDKTTTKTNICNLFLADIAVVLPTSSDSSLIYEESEVDIGPQDCLPDKMTDTCHLFFILLFGKIPVHRSVRVSTEHNLFLEWEISRICHTICLRIQEEMNNFYKSSRNLILPNGI